MTLASDSKHRGAPQERAQAAARPRRRSGTATRASGSGAGEEVTDVPVHLGGVGPVGEVPGALDHHQVGAGDLSRAHPAAGVVAPIVAAGHDEDRQLDGRQPVQDEAVGL